MSDEQQQQPEAQIAPEPVMTDLRTGTEVHPSVVYHYSNYLAGEPYSTPYADTPSPQQKAEKERQEREQRESQQQQGEQQQGQS